MGRGGGKKKGGKKKEAEEVVPVSETPSTSENLPEETTKPPEPEDEDVGLGLESKKRQRKKKKEAASAVAKPASSSLPSVQESESITIHQTEQLMGSLTLGETPSTSGFLPTAGTSTKPPEPDDHDTGLGLGGKKLQRKKIDTAPAVTPTETTSVPTAGTIQSQMQHPAQPSRFKIPPKIISKQPTVYSKPTKVLTNYLKMNMEPRKIHRYDVSFKPDRVKKLIPKAFALAKTLLFPKAFIAFDQMKNCYTLDPLPGVPENDRLITKVEVVDNNGRNVPFDVSFKHTGIVDLGRIVTYIKTGGTSLNPPTEAIQCIDVILRQGTLESYVKCGRQFYKRPPAPIDLTGGLEMWTGLFQSAIFTSRPFINVDVVHKGFPKCQSLLTTFTKDFGLDPTQNLQQRNWNTSAFQDFLKGLRVIAAIGGDTSSGGQRREFICNGAVGPANQEKFDYTDPNTGRQQKITVADFFTKIKGCRIKYPNLNCIWVGPRDKTIYYPMELLEVAYGQVNSKQLNERQLATMVKEAATPPDDRKRKIEDVIRAMNYSKNENFKKFGLTIDDQFHLVDAKVLAPPQLEVAPGRTVTPRLGVWQTNGLLKPEPLRSWGFIAIDTAPTCDFQNIISLMMKMAGEMGMSASRPDMTYFNATMRDFENILFNALKKGIKFLFVIVGTRARDLYHKVKRTAERDIGILTQCIKEVTAARRMNPQTARNILLKVNSKLMGINQVLDNRSTPRCLAGGDVMVVGADVTHPSPDQSSIPSIAAVTASIDPQCYQYNIELSIQTPKKEMIMQFEDMMVDHLKVYKQRQNKLPRKIYVYRDGVSEGQFAEVMASELTAVHNAYQRMTGNPNMKPEVLFLLVQKRHHTRMFVPNSKYNVEPGTVVDKDIVHASELDFYLVSHQAIKGTARPTRYHAVCNDGMIPSDEVEQLTYYLCHLYSRCMRAVSYPTPTYYAHLACLRAKSLTHGDKYDNSQLEKQPKRLHVMDSILQLSRMFFV